jgi:hypothetical protein
LAEMSASPNPHSLDGSLGTGEIGFKALYEKFLDPSTPLSDADRFFKILNHALLGPDALSFSKVVCTLTHKRCPSATLAGKPGWLQARTGALYTAAATFLAKRQGTLDDAILAEYCLLFNAVDVTSWLDPAQDPAQDAQDAQDAATLIPNTIDAIGFMSMGVDLFNLYAEQHRGGKLNRTPQFLQVDTLIVDFMTP